MINLLTTLVIGGDRDTYGTYGDVKCKDCKHLQITYEGFECFHSSCFNEIRVFSPISGTHSAKTKRISTCQHKNRSGRCRHFEQRPPEKQSWLRRVLSWAS